MKLRLTRCRWLRGYPSQNSCDCINKLLLGLFYLISSVKVWLSLFDLWLVWFCTQAYNISSAGHIKKKKGPKPPSKQKIYHITKKVWKTLFRFILYYIECFIYTSQTEARGKPDPPTWKWCRRATSIQDCSVLPCLLYYPDLWYT